MANKKRANGEGSVFYNESEKKWVARIKYGTDINGKAKFKVFSSKKSRKAVIQKLENFKRSEMAGNYDVKKVILNKYIEIWLKKRRKSNNLKLTTINRDETVFNSHIRNTIGRMFITDINEDDIQQLIDSETNRYANKTIEKTYSLLNRVFKFAVNRGDMKNNPCAGVELPNENANAVKAKEIEIYTDEETEKIETAVTDSWENHHNIYRVSPSYILLLNTGMRLGELLALKWDCVNFDNKVIYVRETQEIVKNNGRLQIVEAVPKTKKSKRYVPLNDKALKMLMELKRREDENKIDSCYVVCKNNGDCVNANNYRRDFKRFCNRYDIKYKGLHTFRHTFASRLFEKDVNTKIVSTILGHSNTKITEEVYIHILEEKKAEAIKLLDSVNVL